LDLFFQDNVLFSLYRGQYGRGSEQSHTVGSKPVSLAFFKQNSEFQSWLGEVAHAYNPSDLGGGGRRIAVQG
jgi:hypothetical protein